MGESIVVLVVCAPVRISHSLTVLSDPALATVVLSTNPTLTIVSV